MKLKEYITMEEQAVMMAVANGTVKQICGGDTKAINQMLQKSREARFEK